jgi:hypothetical protein
MARAFTGTIKMSLEGTLSNGTSGATNIENLAISEAFSNGTGASQAQRMWVSEGRTLSASATEDLDMFDLGTFDIGGGAGNDGLGLSHAITAVKGILVHNRATSGGALVIGNKNATTAWNSIFNASDTGAITLPAGATFCYCDPSAAGAAVADSSNHLLKFLDAGSGCTFDVGFIGE